ncbi:hypothetical protein Hypma_006899 [Hypsizygus marmoreus]|uniref:Uncharacterized protein n=1 Tax=Hypsizygus marmoreus TaxID=39966 RepID=A0A369K2W6_HYPMA|nr:hypothetical protein Hypma_006899 [Hypsizygus marmoreus]
MSEDLAVLLTAQQLNSRHPRYRNTSSNSSPSSTPLNHRRRLVIGKLCEASHIVPVLFYERHGFEPMPDELHVDLWVGGLCLLPRWSRLNSHRTLISQTPGPNPRVLTEPYLIHYSISADIIVEPNRRLRLLTKGRRPMWIGSLLIVKLNDTGEVVDLNSGDVPFVETLVATYALSYTDESNSR